VAALHNPPNDMTCLLLPGASPNNEEIPTKDHSRHRIICGDIVAFTELKIFLVTLFDIVRCRGGGRSVLSMLRSAACESPGHGPSTPAPAHHGSRGCQPMSSAPSFLTVLRHLHIYRAMDALIKWSSEACRGSSAGCSAHSRRWCGIGVGIDEKRVLSCGQLVREVRTV
jgi:hypothetical protein